jgi:S1-C subfamily serine protease
MSDLLLVVALLVMVQGGKDVGTATCFFYSKDGIVYLVTNRHVVLDEAKGLRPDTLRVRLHTDANDLTKNVERAIPLDRGAKPAWHVHRDYARNGVDVAVVELDARVTVGTVIKALNRDNFIPDQFLIAPGEDLMVVGFPRGFADTAHNLPIIRGALVASAYGVPFQGAPLFLVDANLHPGMSGSPVMTRPKNIWPDKNGNVSMMTGTPTYFLGVFSATVSVPVSPTEKEALGLGAVWYANLIEEIITAISAKP